MLNLINILINGGEVPPGTLQYLIKKGLLSSKVFTYLEIVSHYNNVLKENNERYTSIIITADKFRISEKTVYNALNFVKVSANE